ncbi:hypothetical protein [Flavobacterium sp. ZB4P13]|uniref:hypothetical protein n=1 Tax=Flavobacterium sp. ZB4P13 TaxID=3401728 RepID=UPI003AAB779B
MKKIIFIGLLLFMALFSCPSKQQLQIHHNNVHNDNGLLEDKDNPKTLILKEKAGVDLFTKSGKTNPTQNLIGISINQRPIRHPSRHRKGKIIYIQNNTKTHNTEFE